MKYVCPECQEEILTVEISDFVPLIQMNGTTVFDADCAVLSWDERSTMVCTECGHSGDARDFKQE